MAYIFEVLEGIMKVYGIDVDRMFDFKEKKAKNKGSFDKKIVIEKV